MTTLSNRIETPRLILREFVPSDVDDVYEFATNPEVSRYTGDAGEYQTRNDAAKLIREVWQRDYRVHGFGRLAVEHKIVQKVIGFCGLKFLEDMQVVDLGYRLLPSYWGKGIATEAARAVMNWSREQNMTGIIGLVMPENTASQRVLEKIGMIHTEDVAVDDIDPVFLFRVIDEMDSI